MTCSKKTECKDCVKGRARGRYGLEMAWSSGFYWLEAGRRGLKAIGMCSWAALINPDA